MKKTLSRARPPPRTSFLHEDPEPCPRSSFLDEDHEPRPPIPRFWMKTLSSGFALDTALQKLSSLLMGSRSPCTSA